MPSLNKTVRQTGRQASDALTDIFDDASKAAREILARGAVTARAQFDRAEGGALALSKTSKAQGLAALTAGSRLARRYPVATVAAGAVVAVAGIFLFSSKARAKAKDVALRARNGMKSKLDGANENSVAAADTLREPHAVWPAADRTFDKAQ